MVGILRALSHFIFFSWGDWGSEGLSNLSKVTAFVDLELRFELRCPQHQNDDEYAVWVPLVFHTPVQSALLLRPVHHKELLGVVTFSGPTVRRAALGPVGPAKPQEGHLSPARRSSSDCSDAQVHYIGPREKVDMSTSGKPNMVNLICASSISGTVLLKLHLSHFL